MSDAAIQKGAILCCMITVTGTEINTELTQCSQFNAFSVIYLFQLSNSNVCDTMSPN